MIFLLNIIDCLDIVRDLNELFQLSHKFPSLYRLVNLVAQIGFLAHFIACGFYFVGSNSDPSENWIITKNI